MNSEVAFAMWAALYVVGLVFVVYGTIVVWQFSHERWRTPVAIGATVVSIPVLFCGAWLVAAVYWLRMRNNRLGRALGDSLIISVLAILAIGAMIAVAALAWSAMS